MLAAVACRTNGATPSAAALTIKVLRRKTGLLVRFPETADGQRGAANLRDESAQSGRLPPFRRRVHVGRIGAVRAAMARAHDPVVMRRRGRGRPGTVLKRSAVARQREALIAPCQADRAQPRERLFVEQEFRLAAGGRAERAHHDLGPRAIFVEREAVEDDGERFPFRQGCDAAEAVAGRIECARQSGIAPIAIGAQPLLGGEGVEALADDLERAVGVPNRRQIAGWRDDDVIARPLRRADDPDEQRAEWR